MKQEQEEIKQKKEYLKSYERVVRQMQRSELRLQEVQLSRICPATINDGMPHVHNNNDLSSYAVQLEQEKKKYLKCRYKWIKKCKEITDKIEQLESEDEKDVLMYRYIKLMKWVDIQQKMGVTERQMYRMHFQALKNFKMS